MGIAAVAGELHGVAGGDEFSLGPRSYMMVSRDKEIAMNKQFRARLQKSPNKADVRKAIGKDAGDTVAIRLTERIEE